MMSPWWADAIELLLKEKQVSKQKLEEKKVISRRELNGWKDAVLGPSLDKLDVVLKGMGVSWQEWALMVDSVQAGRDLDAERKKRQPVKKAAAVKPLVAPFKRQPQDHPLPAKRGHHR